MNDKKQQNFLIPGGSSAVGRAAYDTGMLSRIMPDRNRGIQILKEADASPERKFVDSPNSSHTSYDEKGYSWIEIFEETGDDGVDSTLFTCVEDAFQIRNQATNSFELTRVKDAIVSPSFGYSTVCSGIILCNGADFAPVPIACSVTVGSDAACGGTPAERNLGDCDGQATLIGAMGQIRGAA